MPMAGPMVPTTLSIVNLESSQFFSVITVFVNSRSQSSAVLLTEGISFNLQELGPSVTVLATVTRELLFQESLKGRTSGSSPGSLSNLITSTKTNHEPIAVQIVVHVT